MADIKKDKAEKIKTSALKMKKGDLKAGGFDIEMLRPPEVIDISLHFWISVKNGDGEELVDDPHFVVVNPPLNVPDGTFTDVVDEDGNVTQRHNFMEDPDAAFVAIVENMVNRFLVKRKKL